MVRRVIVQGVTVEVVAANFGVRERTVRKWVKRDRSATGLEDRSSRPNASPRCLPVETGPTPSWNCVVSARREPASPPT
jgi:transposase-like protein